MDTRYDDQESKHAVHLATIRAERRWKIYQQRHAAIIASKTEKSPSIDRARKLFANGPVKLMLWITGTLARSKRSNPEPRQAARGR